MRGWDQRAPPFYATRSSALIVWARAQGIKVHIGEIALDAGDNGRPVHCSTFAAAQNETGDWNDFCIANNDVIIGWNWWGNSAPGWWNQGIFCDPRVITEA